jgi:hypothetical protein
MRLSAPFLDIKWEIQTKVGNLDGFSIGVTGFNPDLIAAHPSATTSAKCAATSTIDSTSNGHHHKITKKANEFNTTYGWFINHSTPDGSVLYEGRITLWGDLFVRKRKLKKVVVCSLWEEHTRKVDGDSDNRIAVSENHRKGCEICRRVHAIWLSGCVDKNYR